jgi:hypothetical protein
MKNEKCDVPAPSEERGAVESVSSFPQHGRVVEAQPTVDGGFDSKPGVWIGDGLKIERVTE